MTELFLCVECGGLTPLLFTSTDLARRAELTCAAPDAVGCSQHRPASGWDQPALHPVIERVAHHQQRLVCKWPAEELID